MNPSGRPPVNPPCLSKPVCRRVGRRAAQRPCAANDPGDNVGSVIRFYFAEHGTGPCPDDGTQVTNRTLAMSLQHFIAPEGRPARRDEIAERITFLSCMFEDILYTDAPER